MYILFTSTLEIKGAHNNNIFIDEKTFMLLLLSFLSEQVEVARGCHYRHSNNCLIFEWLQWYRTSHCGRCSGNSFFPYHF